MKTTPIDEIEDLADGVPVLAVEGTVKYAADLTRNKEGAAHPWTKQFFVLSSGTAEIACSMWDAEGSELAKGEKVHIENTQNKKGQWNGMVKGSYIKTSDKGEKLRMHTLEIRCNQVKITQPNGKASGPTIDTRDLKDADPYGQHGEVDGPPLIDRDWPEAAPVKSEPKRPSMLDERQRAIIRQHSQTAAIEVLKLKQALSELSVEDLTPSKIKALANFFDQDVFDAIA